MCIHVCISVYAHKRKRTASSNSTQVSRSLTVLELNKYTMVLGHKAPDYLPASASQPWNCECALSCTWLLLFFKSWILFMSSWLQGMFLLTGPSLQAQIHYFWHAHYKIKVIIILLRKKLSRLKKSTQTILKLTLFFFNRIEMISWHGRRVECKVIMALVVESTHCSCAGPKFSSHHLCWTIQNYLQLQFQ